VTADWGLLSLVLPLPPVVVRETGDFNERNYMKLFILAFAITLSGCGTYGEPLILAQWYDSRDSCQKQNWRNGAPPNFCGATSGRTYIYPKNGAPIGYIGK